MKHYPMCTSCQAKTKPLFIGTYDLSTYDKRGRRPNKLKKPSEYRMVLKCRRNSCQEHHVFSGRSRSVVHRQINSLFQTQRKALINASRAQESVEANV